MYVQGKFLALPGQNVMRQVFKDEIVFERTVVILLSIIVRYYFLEAEICSFAGANDIQCGVIFYQSYVVIDCHAPAAGASSRHLTMRWPEYGATAHSWD